MAETRERSCYTCFHRPACAGMIEAQGLAYYVNLGSQSSGRCPDYIFSGDVSRVRHGRWLDVQETDMYVPDLKLTATKTAEKCSVCKARIGLIGPKLYLFDSFCPSCGAKMDLEVPENETL